jgi:hypothetical protein
VDIHISFKPKKHTLSREGNACNIGFIFTHKIKSIFILTILNLSERFTLIEDSFGIEYRQQLEASQVPLNIPSFY